MLPRSAMGHSVLIPAYCPELILRDLIRELIARGFDQIIVVDDGSGNSYQDLFEQIESMPGVVVLRHAVNLGKGAALKTGFNYFLLSAPEKKGLVTADADNQHSPDDILRVSDKLQSSSNSLVLGTRSFAGKVPVRSWIGNRITALVFALLTGRWIKDTQTGLRGIPSELIRKLMRIRSNGFDFELEALILSKSAGFSYEAEPIRTVYLEGNRGSKFNPLLDSFKIYFVFLRFVSSSFVTASIDYFVFFFSFWRLGDVVLSTGLGRGTALLVNFILVRVIVFRSHRSLLSTFPAYLLLVIVLGFLSATMIKFLMGQFGWGVVASKVVAEGILYLANFSVQRELIFFHQPRAPSK